MTEPRQLRHLILGTAGHIDHGKTSLVRALTGIDTDRLPEERARGMTIELGFAKLELEDFVFGIVDVPGHERFVRTMVSGATGMDVALLVVAADDSVMPQTIEHAQILDLLGVTHVVVAITKIDAVEADMVDLVEEEVRSLIAEMGFGGAPVVRVSSSTGEGLAEVRTALVEAANATTSGSAAMPFRLAVDRVFSAPGRGTVVTGSALSGETSVGETLDVMPGGGQVRVRDLQAHGESHERIGRGHRCAINVSGDDKDRIGRGCELAAEGLLAPSQLIDVEIRSLSGTPEPLDSATRVRLEMGTSEAHARLVLLDRELLSPGERGFAQLRTAEPVACAWGQRFIVRSENASRTIGGGRVLRPDGPRRRLNLDEDPASLARLGGDDAASRLCEVLRRHPRGAPSDVRLAALTGIPTNQLEAARRALADRGELIALDASAPPMAAGAIADLRHRVERHLRRFHASAPAAPGQHASTILSMLERRTDKGRAKALLDRFLGDGWLKKLGQFVCLKEFAPKLSKADEKALSEMTAELLAVRFQPPPIDSLAAVRSLDRKRVDRLAKLATALGEIVPLEQRIFLHAACEGELRETVRGLIETRGAVTVSEVREALDSSRKFVVPFLEHLDRVGFTRREGDARVLA